MDADKSGNNITVSLQREIGSSFLKNTDFFSFSPLIVKSTKPVGLTFKEGTYLGVLEFLSVHIPKM